MIKTYNTTFTDRFQKAVKFYDFVYHQHKSTFKGLNSFYKQYSQIEKSYAESLLKLSKSVQSQIPQLNRQNQSFISVIKEVTNCIQTTSQLHYNYSERLTQVSQFYNAQYNSSKRKKENHMKMIKDKNQQQYYALRDREKNRNALNAKQKDICKILYENFDKLAQQENQRIHKIKQQTIIYFSLYKKVCEKQLEFTSQYNLKLVKQQFQVKNPKIAEISEQIRIQFNQYGGQQRESKNYDINKSMTINRQSLRQSMMMKERASRLEQTQNKLRTVLQKYQGGTDNLLTVTQPDNYYGVFNQQHFGKQQKRKYSRQINSQLLKNIAYDMIEGYCKAKNCDSDQLSLLQLIKASLRIKPNRVVLPDFKCQNIQVYWNQVPTKISDKQYLFHLGMLQQLSRNSSSYSNIDKLIQKKQRREISANDVKNDVLLNTNVKTCILDILIQSLCVSRPDQPVLAPSYIDYMELIANFGEGFLSVDKSVTVLLLLRKLDRLIANKDQNQQIQEILNTPYFLQPSKSLTQSRTKKSNQQYQNLKYTWSSIIINSTTEKLVHFYKLRSPFLNYVKILFVIEKLGLSHNPSFSARDHFYMCVRYAGFNYMKTSQECVKFFNPDNNTPPESRLRYIVEGIEQLDYEGVLNQYINPAIPETSKLLGVGQKIVKCKLFDEFTSPTFDLIDGNLTILSEQEGVDREGYILRLGVIFAKLDIQNPQPITQYENFFHVLRKYLEATQKDYDLMLERSRQTQLWIMQQNSLATPNCIDFCSLMYKPLQFLLISLKEVQKSKKTEYTKKYAEYIKLRLNTVLKTEIIKYVNFLYESLAKYRYQPNQLAFKPKRMEKPHILKRQQMQKQRQFFKQLTRRLFNLLFLRDQLEEMVCDFIEPEVRKKLDNSILNVDKLNKLSGQAPQYRDMLTNIKDIVQAVMSSQKRIVTRVAQITVFQCMCKIFQNLYYQQQKNAIQQFFSNAADYKLSQHTFLKCQEIMQDWLTQIARNIPTQYTNLFEVQFLRSFFQAIQYQVLNSTKFKLPLKLPNVIQYLDSDVAFVTTLIKQKKLFSQNIINEQMKRPFQELLANLQAQTPKLASAFEAATLKNDKQKCKYILIVLNLRIKDEKAIEFVKRYKSISQ